MLICKTIVNVLICNSLSMKGALTGLIVSIQYGSLSFHFEQNQNCGYAYSFNKVESGTSPGNVLLLKVKQIFPGNVLTTCILKVFVLS